MVAVKELGLRDNTFVYFTSDNGPHLEEINSGEYHGRWKGMEHLNFWYLGWIKGKHFTFSKNIL